MGNKMKDKSTRKHNPENTLDGLEFIINNRNHDKLDGILRKAQEFLARNYTPDEVLSYESAKEELSKVTNEAYTWMVAKNAQGKVVGAVVFDVWPIPRTPINEKLISDGRNHYTPIFYATASEGYEAVLKELIEKTMQFARQYSSDKGKRNIGVLTGDTKHAIVLRELAKQYGGGYLGKVGVPTLDDEKVSQDYEVNFKAESHEKLIFIPFNERWTKSIAKRAVVIYLDESYNARKRGDEGYRPLTTAPFYNVFSEMIDRRNPGRFISPMPITFTK